MLGRRASMCHVSCDRHYGGLCSDDRLCMPTNFLAEIGQDKNAMRALEERSTDTSFDRANMGANGAQCAMRRGRSRSGCPVFTQGEE